MVKANVSRFVFGTPRLVWSHGYQIIKLPIMYKRAVEAYPVFGNASWEDDDLPIKLRGLQCDGLEVTAQKGGIGPNPNFYGWKATYREMHHIDLKKARAMCKTLERIEHADRSFYQAAGPLPSERFRAIESTLKAFAIDRATGWAVAEDVDFKSCNETRWTYAPVASLLDCLAALADKAVAA